MNEDSLVKMLSPHVQEALNILIKMRQTRLAVSEVFNETEKKMKETIWQKLK